MEHKLSLIVANWKMHKGIAEAKSYLLKLKALSFTPQVWIAVPFTALLTASEIMEDTAVKIGAQNASDLLEGALTGEISPSMVLEAGGSFVILGHSERRRLFHEDNAFINRKIKLALSLGLQVILCVGETKDERDASLTSQVITKQLEQCLFEVSSFENLVIAYEPLWAIGTNQPATPEIVEKIHHLCKNWIANRFEVALDQAKILYGGSVSSKNAGAYLAMASIDGLLVGGASLDFQSFAEIIHQAEA